MTDRDFATRQLHGGNKPYERGALVSPIYNSVTYTYDTPSSTTGKHRYARMSEPTRDRLDALIADLENGTYAKTFSSGMAAINTLFTSVLSAGDNVIAGRNLYAKSHTLLTRIFAKFDVEVTFVDTTDIAAVSDAIEPETSLIYLESPTNPLLQISDIASVAEIAAESDADPVLAVDNTFASPYLQRPLDLGADVVVESLTKYVSGHSDVMAGALVTNDAELDETFEYVQYNQGATPSPFSCFLLLRGAKTLACRMENHCENARTIAAFLDGHRDVEEVYYPGLEEHPGHDIAVKQMDDFGGMVSFELDATVTETSAVISNTSIFQLAESLGGVESLVEQPAVMTHQDLTSEEMASIGLSETLIRVSVGIEDADDLKRDLETAIESGLESG